jgi:hypothetical protein
MAKRMMAMRKGDMVENSFTFSIHFLFTLSLCSNHLSRGILGFISPENVVVILPLLDIFARIILYEF